MNELYKDKNWLLKNYFNKQVFKFIEEEQKELTGSGSCGTDYIMSKEVDACIPKDQGIKNKLIFHKRIKIF